MPSPPASVEIRMSVLVLNSLIAAFLSSMSIDPLSSEQEYPRRCRKSFKNCWVATNSVNIMACLRSSSLFSLSKRSTRYSAFASVYWNCACFATDSILLSSLSSHFKSNAATDSKASSRAWASVSDISSELMAATSACWFSRIDIRLSILSLMAAVLLETNLCISTIRKPM